jgi:6-phosphofructokinase
VAESLAILVGGGPAPGINGVIASAAMEAFKCGLRAIGIYDGYRDLAAGRTPETVELTFDPSHVAHESGQRRRDASALRRLACRTRRALSRLHRRR